MRTLQLSELRIFSSERAVAKMGVSHSMDLYMDRPSSETGLRRRELKALTAFWAVIERDLRDQSIKLFVRLMRKHPEYRRYFGTMAASSTPVLTTIAADARVQSHFRTILTSVGSLVDNAAHNPDNLPPKYDFLALVHRHIGLSRLDFYNFRDELIDYFRSEFPSQMTPLCVGAWYTFLTGAFNEIFDRIEEFHRNEAAAARHSKHGKHCKYKRRSRQQEDDDIMAKSVASMFESRKDVLYWDHRKPFWKMQQEMWGEASDDEWYDEEDEEQEAWEAGLGVPDPLESRRLRLRRWWRRLVRRLRRFMCGK